MLVVSSSRTSRNRNHGGHQARKGRTQPLLDRQSRWWCCGISLRYGRHRHSARESWRRRCSRREVHRELGSLRAGRGPASLEVHNGGSDTDHTMDTLRVLVVLPPTDWGLGAVRMVAAPTPPPRPQRLSSEPSSHGESNQDLPVSKLAADSRLVTIRGLENAR